MGASPLLCNWFLPVAALGLFPTASPRSARLGWRSPWPGNGAGCCGTPTAGTRASGLPPAPSGKVGGFLPGRGFPAVPHGPRRVIVMGVAGPSAPSLSGPPCVTAVSPSVPCPHGPEWRLRLQVRGRAGTWWLAHPQSPSPFSGARTRNANGSTCCGRFQSRGPCSGESPFLELHLSGCHCFVFSSLVAGP